MKQIIISDVTMKQTADGFSLSFKEKIELSKLLDKLGVDVIELEGIQNQRIDSLRIKSIAAAVKDSILAVPVDLNPESVQRTWEALQQAKRPRLQVCAPLSTVQMEYLFHKKPEAMLKAIAETITACRALCADVEFVADDASRSEKDFLVQALQTAMDAGASTVTLCDTAGTMLPAEFGSFVQELYAAAPQLQNVKLGISCVNTLSMADACAIEAVIAGASQISAAAYTLDNVNLVNISRLLAAKADSLGVSCNVRVTQLSRAADQIAWLCQANKTKSISFAAENTGIALTVHDDRNAVAKAVETLGYDLSEEDMTKVYQAFCQIAAKKEQVSSKELDAIVASAAMQVPSTYKLDTYVITSGNTISATAHIKLMKNDVPVEGVYIGDGSIDAAFQAIERITGCHYELDDFQLQAVTEGREAMGQTVVKLRSNGKVYSGRGISTDIVGAGIGAYLSALNKIIYEEEAE